MNINLFKNLFKGPGTPAPETPVPTITSQEKLRTPAAFATAMGFIMMSLEALAGGPVSPAELVKFKDFSSPEKNKMLVKELFDRYGSKVSKTFKNMEAKTDAEISKGFVRSFESNGTKTTYSEEFIKDKALLVIKYIDANGNGNVDEVDIWSNGQPAGGMKLDDGAGKAEANNTAAGGSKDNGISGAAFVQFEGNDRQNQAQVAANSAFGNGLTMILGKGGPKAPVSGLETSQN